MIGGGLVLLGSFLPWATIRSAVLSSPGSLSVNGTDGDGQITLVLALVIVGIGVVGLMGRPRFWLISLIAGCLAALVAVIDIIDVSRTAGEVESAYLDASVGIGLWVVLAGAVVAVVGAWFLRAGRSSA
ncbi:MAG TPA: hypothetical protein VF382_02360 [Actinomycetota bacterium]